MTSELPGWATPDEHQLEAMVRAELGSPDARVRTWWTEPVGHAINAPGTAALHLVRGTTTDDQDWSLFVKVLQSQQFWPGFDLMPAALREIRWPWDFEVDVYRSEKLRGRLPAGLRMPQLHQVYDSGDQRLAMWLEDVRTATVDWDLARYTRAATLLGRLGARLTLDDLLPPSAPTEVLRMAVRGPIESLAIPALSGEAVWRHPLLAGLDPALREDLIKLAARIPDLLGAAERLPRAMVHGDACPQNLLVPADDPDGFVPVDWSPGGSAPAGYDLGQLVIGHAHSGLLGPDDLPALGDAVVESYAAGLAWEGLPIDVDDVRYGFQAVLVLRSAFMSLPLDRLGEPPSDELAEHLAGRVRLTRYLVDLGLSL